MPDGTATTLSATDVQSQAPSVRVSLSRVGVTNVEKVIRLRQDGSEQLFYAKLDCFVDLGPEQKGAHMSRFEEVVNEAIGEVILGEATFKAETLAERVATIVRDRQGARRAEVRLEARFPEHKPAPVSGIETQEIYTLYGTAVASEAGTRRLTGVQAQGMTACPCAQGLVEEAARGRLLADGFTDDEIRRVFESEEEAMAAVAATAIAVGRRLDRRRALHGAEQLLFGHRDLVERLIGTLVVAADQLAALGRHDRGCAGLGLVDLGALLDVVDQPFLEVVRGDRRLRDLTQGDHGVLVVVGLDRLRLAIGERPRPVGSEQHELEAVRNLVDAILDGYTRHVSGCLRINGSGPHGDGSADEARCLTALIPSSSSGRESSPPAFAPERSTTARRTWGTAHPFAMKDGNEQASGQPGGVSA